MEDELRASFSRLRADAPIGAAIAAPGGATVSLGEWSTGVAWSTIKVPLAIAALRADPARAQGHLAAAIARSDNPASEALWSQLGEPPEAARRVQAVIAEAGDGQTVVESRRLRDGFTPFGQTRWSLRAQACFAARLPALDGAAPVIELMSSLTPAQRWGLAAKGIAAKGGWGPGLRGDYLVRQFGTVPSASGQAGVALAAQAESLEAGVDLVNRMADWLAGHLSALTERKAPHRG
ncbi:hypothetical protein BN971_02505 [Mycobacterium bohemicum DSM 44277]|uniref:Serine hydrolase n=2 Tax=Mycobacterium bohemicum TaxID=56425 RepID=A0A1X1QYK1_MYCBE|nr:hypothetical protein [Mycobacterium bohemicum]MCV6971723.1 hypothetical protein [Mycobacterium bohemicum]ORU96443.1 hypothetical protein AWB93_21120 [Mycobacterium bohemicum]CPR11225.1 hypothetical protein BN971_02505 [Mycobacterium bohemicum DSM 44277]